jgi:hypothetical protein
MFHKLFLQKPVATQDAISVLHPAAPSLRAAASAPSGTAEAMPAAGACAFVLTVDDVPAFDGYGVSFGQGHGNAPAGFADKSAEGGRGNVHAPGGFILGKSFGIDKPERFQHVKAKDDGKAAGALRPEPGVFRLKADGAGLGRSHWVPLYEICFTIGGEPTSVNSSARGALTATATVHEDDAGCHRGGFPLCMDAG